MINECQVGRELFFLSFPYHKSSNWLVIKLINGQERTEILKTRLIQQQRHFSPIAGWKIATHLVSKPNSLCINQRPHALHLCACVKTTKSQSALSLHQHGLIPPAQIAFIKRNSRWRQLACLPEPWTSNILYQKNNCLHLLDSFSLNK